MDDMLYIDSIVYCSVSCLYVFYIIFLCNLNPLYVIACVWLTTLHLIITCEIFVLLGRFFRIQIALSITGLSPSIVKAYRIKNVFQSSEDFRAATFAALHAIIFVVIFK